MSASGTLADSSGTIETRTASTDPHHKVKKYKYIDALRGYAVLLVITCHAGGMFPELPYPVKKLTNVGWHGVQLFFLLSCVTLMLSWRSDERKGITSAASFWSRRFFRIAPMYYLAAAFYFLLEPPVSGFDLKQLLASVFFVNAWHPTLIPTVPNRWMVVPGGWSIGVEFTFYFLFPLLIAPIKRLRVAVGFLVAAILIACIANTLEYNFLVGTYGQVAVSNFVYFWLPNQLPIFALGTVLFFLIERARHDTAAYTAFLRNHSVITVAICVLVYVLLAEKDDLTSGAFSAAPLHLLPHLFAAALIFVIFTLTLALDEDSIFVNRAICELGKVSFSAYLLHFFILHTLARRLPFLDVKSTNFTAIAHLFALWTISVPLTYLLSKITYTFIELPMIARGNKVAERVRAST